MRPTLLAAALFAIGLQVTDAQALGLGGLRVRSALGEPFRAEVALIGSGESTPASTCFSIETPPSMSADDLPWLGSGRMRIQGRTLHISSSAPINEPVLMVGVRVGCGFEVSRDYTVLMQPMGAAPEDAPVASAAPAAPAATAADSAVPAPARTRRADSASRASEGAAAPVDAAAEPARAAPRKAKAKRAEGSGDRLFVAPGLEGGALKMSGGMASRPEATEAQREALRSEQKLLAALDEQIATHLAIADKVKHLEARLAELQKQLDRSGAALDAARAPALAAPPATPLSNPAVALAPSVQAETRPAVTPPVEAERSDGPSGDVPSASPQEQLPAPVAQADVPPPAPGLTNEPVKVVTKLPPDAAAEDPAAELPGVDWMVAGLGLAAAGAVLGGSWLWRRRAARIAAARARREQELAASLANRPSPRRRDDRAADSEYAHGDGFRPGDTQPAQSAVSASPAPAVAMTASFEGRPQSPTYSLTPPVPQVQEVASIDFFPGEAPAEHMEDMEIAASPAATEADEPGKPSAAVPDLEFSTSSIASVDFELGNDAETPAVAPARLDLEFDSFSGSTSSNGLSATQAEAFSTQGPRLVSSQPSVPATTGMAIDQSAHPANEEAAPSHEHVLELAEIMMSFGRAEGAAQTLSDFLRDYPKESLVPWLKLLDLYHKGGRRGEYDDLAPKLNRAFNVKVPQWEEFTGPLTSESVEQFAHIMARVNATWPGQDCLDYLTELLRDNRAGTRIGFPLGVIDDILLLKSMLEWLIANPPMTNTSASRLAQL